MGQVCTIYVQHCRTQLHLQLFINLTLVHIVPSVVMLYLLVTALLVFGRIEALEYPLSPDYYRESCPLALEIVRQHLEVALYRDPRLAAAILRLHFHDCFVMGCDASLLLDDKGGIISEKQAGPNLNSLRGFDIIDKIKALLEEACPHTVSCADILAIAARDSVHLRGGPSWEVELGRRDSLKANFNGASKFIPSPNSTLQMLISNFEVQGLDVVDLVALSGAHTIGLSRCVSFRARIYGREVEEHPDYYHRDLVFRRALRSVCPTSGRDNDRVPLDIHTSTRFDNLYYHNLLQDKGLLLSDKALLSHELEAGAARLVWAYAENQELFFRHFASSMIKMGRINVLTGSEGEIRHSCRFLNSY